MAMLSCGRMIWLLPHPSASCLSFSLFQCVASSAYYGRGGGWERSQMIRRRECLVLYKSFNTLWDKLSVRSFHLSSLCQCDSQWSSIKKISNMLVKISVSHIYVQYIESLLYKPGPSEQRTYCTYYDVKDGMSHKVLIQYRLPLWLSPRRNWASPTPLSPASVPLPRKQRGVEHTRLQVRGWGSPNSDDWKKA